MRSVFSASSPRTISARSTTSNWNLRSAEKLESSETAFACDQRPGLIDNDWMQKADIFDAPGKAAKVAKIAAMPLADLDRGDGDEAVGTGLSDL